VLQPLQDRFQPGAFPDLLVGLGQPDDAAVYRLGAGQAVVQTVDFFPPVVDDPYDFGAIAAANAMSDVYAMGGQVLFALNLCAFPEDLPPEAISDILRGGADKVFEAGGAIAGGHSVRDREPKYGLSVTGLVHPDRLLTKGGARPGDALLLTKPLGSGVITTALKRGQADPAHVAAATAVMARLNREASRVALAFGARAATDITGFGLAGHALEMAEQSGARFRLAWDALPFMAGAFSYAEQWIFAGGAETNEKAYAGRARIERPGMTDWQRMLLFDPQTSGGLLMAVPGESAGAALAALRDAGEAAAVIGEVVSGDGLVVA
jgi:selenide,water dikinase